MKVDLIALLFREYSVFFQPLIETTNVATDGKVTVDTDDLRAFFMSIGFDLEPMIPDAAFWENVKVIIDALVTLSHKVKDITPLVEKTLDSIDFPNDIESLKLMIKELPKDTQGLVDFYGNLKPEVDKIIKGFKELKDYYDKLQDINGNADFNKAIKRLPIVTLNALTCRYLTIKHNAIMPSLELLGLVEWGEQKQYKYNNKVAVVDNIAPRFHLEKVKPLCQNPESYLNGIYFPSGYGTTVAQVNDSAKKLFPLIQEILESFGAQTHFGLLPSELGIVYAPEITAEMLQRMEGTLTWQIPAYDVATDQLLIFGASLGLLVDNSTDEGPGVFILPFGNFAFNKTIKGWLLKLVAVFQNDGFKINKGGIDWFVPSTQQTLDLSIATSNTNKWFLGGATRIEIEKPEIKAALVLPSNGEPTYDFSMNFKKNDLIIASGNNDFFSNLLDGGNIDSTFNLKLGWNSLNKFYLEGRGEIDLKLNFTLFHLVRFHFIKLKLNAPKLELSIKAGIEFPPSLFQPLDAAGNIDPNSKSEIAITLTGVIDTSSGKGFVATQMQSFTFTKSAILNTGFTLELEDVELDLSHTTNIAEANLDGRPADFIGVYMKKGVIGFPKDWKHNDTASKAELYLKNLLVGTGGVSGTIGLRSKPSSPSSTEPHGITLELSDKFTISLTSFDLTFKQNAIIASNIQGTLLIKDFKDAANKTQDAKINIDVHIGTDGEFKIVASSTVQTITAIHLENVFDFHIKSLFIGRQSKESGGHFYVGLSGDLDFLLQAPLGKFLPDKIDIKKLIVYDTGKYEFEGGSIVLPKAFELKLGPAKIGITAIHLGSYEKEGRKYKYFGFDGGVNVNPGGVDARGKGIKYYYTVDGPYTKNVHDFKWFIRLESLAIDIYIPDGGTPENAAVIIKGFLSIKDPKIPEGTVDPLLTILKNATEYAGGVYISIPKFKGLEASASMRLTPQVPAFIIDLGIEISTPILLGTTGLGIYGFRAIFGKRYVATKTAADIPEDGEWWQYYKAKIDPDYKEGIQLSKFSIKEGFSVGAGVSLATSSDSGKAFSSKLFFLLSLPDVFLFQGQAQFLKDRIKLDANPDPPFFAIIAITKKSIEAGFGINYKMPEDSGKLVTVDGVTELGFFFGDSAAWYFNIGRESPDSMRIQARLFDILNMYFYFMMSNSGIRAGAGVSIEMKKSFGPLSAELSGYLDTKGRISFRPKQIGGVIQMGGTVSLKCCGFGFSVSGGATLSAEAPKPHIITGEFEVSVKVLKKERKAHFEFTWNFENNLNESRNAVLVDITEGGQTIDKDALNKVAKATNMVTGETLNLAAYTLLDDKTVFSTTIPNPKDAAKWGILPEDCLIPLDSFIDIEFKKGLNVTTGTNLDKIGGMSSPCEYIEFVPPQRGKSDRVRHEYFLEGIEIFYWDENSLAWKPYNFYDAMIPMFPTTEQVTSCITPSVLKDMKWGYWQQQRPGFNNKLRILATTPLSYAAKTGVLPVEDLGINGSTILCPGAEVPKTCVVFEKDTVYKTFAANVLHAYKGVTFKITTKEGIVLNNPYLKVENGLSLQPGDSIELFFKEPMKSVDILINSIAPRIIVDYYMRTRVLDPNAKGGFAVSGGLPVFKYDLIESKIYTPSDWQKEITYSNAQKNIDYIKITSVSCYDTPNTPNTKAALTPSVICLNKDEQTAINLAQLKDFITFLLTKGQFTAPSVQLSPQNVPFYKSSKSANASAVPKFIDLIQGYMSGTTLLFTLSDNLEYNCHFSFELLNPPVRGFSFANIDSVVRLEPYTTGAIAGINYSFILTVTVKGVGGEVQIIGKSCLPMAYCFDRCSSFLYRVCYLPYTDYLLNQTIPTLATQYTNNQALLNGINKTLQPIWRPNTTFAIRLKTSDKLYRDGSSTVLKIYDLDMVYGFKTAGPVGHFHEYPINNTPMTQVKRADYAKLEDPKVDRPDDFKLLSLKYYIDFPKCYPNADGDIMNAKPLFYKKAELRLFYLYNHLYEFYNDWKDSNGNILVKSSLEVLVRDPVDSGIAEDKPALSFVGNSISHDAGVGFPPKNINSINNDINILNNILLNNTLSSGSIPCITQGTPFTPLAPIDISTKKTLYLKPLKLYTAQFIAKYNPLISGKYAKDAQEINFKDYESVVHSYVFQTSRYASFEEQVNSYILKKNTEGSIEKVAVFILSTEKAGTKAQLDLAKAVITNDEAAIPDPFKLQYADQFDRLINGVLQIDYNKLHAAVTTEFNIIVNAKTKAVIGVFIRNPEPFNDPKLPRVDPNKSSTEPNETLEVIKKTLNGWGTPLDHYVIHSKDRTKMFVTNRNFNFNMSYIFQVLKFQFRYKLYNGVDYADASVVEVSINLPKMALSDKLDGPLNPSKK